MAVYVLDRGLLRNVVRNHHWGTNLVVRIWHVVLVVNVRNETLILVLNVYVFICLVVIVCMRVLLLLRS